MRRAARAAVIGRHHVVRASVTSHLDCAFIRWRRHLDRSMLAWLRAGVCLSLLVTAARGAEAQAAAGSSGAEPAVRGGEARTRQTPSARAEPWLPASHWSRGALRTLAALGVVDAGAALDAWPVSPAVARDGGESTYAGVPRPLPDVWLDAAHAGVLGLRARAGFGYSDVEGALRGGTTFRAESGAWVYPGPDARADPRGTTMAARIAVLGPTDHLAAVLDTRIVGDEARVDEAYAVAAAGPIAAWLGRRPLGFGPGMSGSLVLSGHVPFDGIGVTSRDGFSLPGVLGALGTVRATASLARLERSGTVERPWFGAVRIGMQPHPSIAIGLNRALLLGGEGNAEATSARNVLLAFAGLTGQLGKDSGFENQVASIDVWLRARVLGLPWGAYAEWAADDVGFSFAKVSALLAGIELARLPFAPGLSLAVEHVRIPGSCCGHPPWYRHGGLGDGWTVEGRPIGHPLGGHGSEWSAHTRYATDRVWLEAAAFSRERGPENLFAPDRLGSSRGGRIVAEFVPIRSARVRANTAIERGDGWTAWSLDIGADVAFAAGNPTSD